MASRSGHISIPNSEGQGGDKEEYYVSRRATGATEWRVKLMREILVNVGMWRRVWACLRNCGCYVIVCTTYYDTLEP